MQRRLFMSALGAILLGAVVTIVTSVRQAEARVGRPASPGSVGGVNRSRRRRRRRRVRRLVVVGLVISTLPQGCSSRVRDGVTYQYCDGVWYQPTYEGTQVTYVVESVDEGTEAYVETDEE